MSNDQYAIASARPDPAGLFGYNAAPQTGMYA